jgi:hypothetical protein
MKLSLLSVIAVSVLTFEHNDCLWRPHFYDRTAADRPAISSRGKTPMTTSNASTLKKPYHEMKASERLAARIAQNRAMDERVANRSHMPARSPQNTKIYSSENNDVRFTHAETFPVIASVLTKLCSAKNEFVGHREIVQAMLNDPEIGRSLDLIIAKTPDEHPREWWGHSMMKWFSQAFTTRSSPYSHQFERESHTRPYRYRIRQT